MNEGRICVSVQARTIAEFVERITAARRMAGLVELRFDYLEPAELALHDFDAFKASMGRIMKAIDHERCITTFRPLEFGGHREISAVDRELFWNSGFETELADLEEDVVDWSWSWLWGERICSFHDFDGVPADLEAIFRRLAATEVDIVKIAASVDDATEAIPVWNLLKHAKPKVIPIGMGEAGKWTRILGLANGSPISYAAPDDEHATAPGQISATDMRDVFRVRELDVDTEVYAVLAGDTSYSLSPYMHNASFKIRELNSVFVPMQVTDLDAFMRRMVKGATREVELNFRGFSVTNPHKRNVTKYLDGIDPAAEKIGAVNTIKVDDGKLHGYNTDAPGFIGPLLREFGDLHGARVTIIGAGGASRACVFALKENGADVTLVARDPRKAKPLSEEFDIRVAELGTGNWRLETEILINATPLGTRGENENETVATAEELRDVKLVYDLVYNPSETRLLREARIAGAKTIGGLDMLIAQGAKQFEIWTGQKPPVDAMREAIESRLK
jgi:3-dehydroquinate dehydratase/shikimate dehydrogenase